MKIQLFNLPQIDKYVNQLIEQYVRYTSKNSDNGNGNVNNQQQNNFTNTNTYKKGVTNNNSMNLKLNRSQISNNASNVKSKSSKNDIFTIDRMKKLQQKARYMLRNIDTFINKNVLDQRVGYFYMTRNKLFKFLEKMKENKRMFEMGEMDGQQEGEGNKSTGRKDGDLGSPINGKRKEDMNSSKKFQFSNHQQNYFKTTPKSNKQKQNLIFSSSQKNNSNFLARTNSKNDSNSNNYQKIQQRQKQKPATSYLYSNNHAKTEHEYPLPQIEQNQAQQVQKSSIPILNTMRSKKSQFMMNTPNNKSNNYGNVNNYGRSNMSNMRQQRNYSPFQSGRNASRSPFVNSNKYSGSKGGSTFKKTTKKREDAGYNNPTSNKKNITSSSKQKDLNIKLKKPDNKVPSFSTSQNHQFTSPNQTSARNNYNQYLLKQAQSNSFQSSQRKGRPVTQRSQRKEQDKSISQLQVSNGMRNLANLIFTIKMTKQEYNEFKRIKRENQGDKLLL